MKRAFISTANGHLASALVPVSTKDLLSLGDRITVSRVMPVGHGAWLSPGECGTIAHIDASTGLVDILMDLEHRGLHLWHNHIWIEPFGTEDIINGIVLLRQCVSTALQCVA